MVRSLLGYFIVILFFCLSSKADAATIILLSGQKIVGDIIEQTELRVTVDVLGSPKTFYLGEIASIDGREVEVPQPKLEEEPQENTHEMIPAAKNPNVTAADDEQVSLERFMSKKNVPSKASDKKPSVTPTPVKPVNAPSSPVTTPALTASAVKMDEGKRNVLSTSDGGLIVVDQGSIVKYDKDLNVVKKVDLNT